MSGLGTASGLGTRLSLAPTVLAAMVLALAVIACAGLVPLHASPPPGSTTPDPHATPTVVATWTADDGSVVALNVVAAPGTQLREVPGLARSIRSRYPGSRVIVNVFASTAGPERYVLGRVPAGGEPVLPERRPSTWMASYDFPPMAGR